MRYPQRLSLPPQRRLFLLARLTAGLGNASAQHDTGTGYLDGRGVAASASLAAQSGHVEALFNLALLTQSGEGVQQDLQRTIRLWYQSGILALAAGDFTRAVAAEAAIASARPDDPFGAHLRDAIRRHPARRAVAPSAGGAGAQPARLVHGSQQQENSD